MHRNVMVLFACALLALPSTASTPDLVGPYSAHAQDSGLNFELERASEASEFLDRLEAIGFRGAVLVASGDEILISRGYGWADQANSVRIGPDTVFAIGSNTKPFTAAAILLLQDHDKLSVSDHIGRFLPNVPPHKQAITIHQLLTHSAGFDHSGIFEGDFEDVGRDEAVRRILASELLFPPGSASSYADASMIVLAAIVEHASGQSYDAFLRDEIFAPAGMEHTGFRADDPGLRGATQATGTVGSDPAGTPADLPPVTWALKGAGGMVSTVEDLFSWHQAVTGGEILSPDGQRAFEAAHVPIDDGAAEGYGWVMAEPAPGHRLRASAGGTEEIGHVNVIDWWIDDDLVVIASSADAAFNAEDVTQAIERILFGLPQDMPPPIVEVEPGTLRQFAGRYDLPEGGAILVSAAGNRLLLSPEGVSAFAALFPPPADDSGDHQEIAESTIAYLESSKDEVLEPWKAEMASELGPFQHLLVLGTAPHEGGGEVWTYVAFEFAGGSALTRWIVEEGGVLTAAELPSEPPALMLLPTSPRAFETFALGQTTSFAAAFSTEASGIATLTLNTPSGETITATKQR